jgi:predicted ATPase
MQLLRARVTNFKSIQDSTWVRLGDVTCLVGKNESGKTAFLQALRKMSPAGGSGTDFDLRDYPRKGLARYRATHQTRPAEAAAAEFELLPEEMLRLEEAFGPAVLASPRVVVRKNYRNETAWDLDLGPHCAHLAERVIQEHLVEFLPGLVYFDEYSLLPGKISLAEFRRRQAEGRLDDSDRTFLALLRLAGVRPGALEDDQDYEGLRAELEAASATLTDEVLRYWTQNRKLRVEMDVAGGELHLRIWNERHRVSTPFGDRSRGFVWFFSFLACFSQLDVERADYVFLLDEPGLNLHAQAQKDFLRFIEERLAPQHPVVYTTHSPFLIDPARLDRVRTVEDVDGRGTVVSEDLERQDPDTVLPIEAAMAFERLRSVPLWEDPRLGAPVIGRTAGVRHAATHAGWR